jgi:hypothetical protein
MSVIFVWLWRVEYVVLNARDAEIHGFVRPVILYINVLWPLRFYSLGSIKIENYRLKGVMSALSNMSDDERSGDELFSDVNFTLIQCDICAAIVRYDDDMDNCIRCGKITCYFCVPYCATCRTHRYCHSCYPTHECEMLEKTAIVVSRTLL